ncbi:placenta-specific protein 9 [Carlito syrichta]|uniref:Placenta-specific protein 9 n=1 Tax=Carlito syrichta TaxID=1868482 RepID=A0A1U7T3Y4_CARSF|nr:placenta-specific protein 9 [Carlito syrichta]
MGQQLHEDVYLGLWVTVAIQTTAEAFSPSQGDPAQSTGCDRHMAVHHRLDVMEETVEKTVEHLEAEVKGLLGLLEELAWNLPPGPFSPAPDLLGDDHF